MANDWLDGGSIQVIWWIDDLKKAPVEADDEK